MKKVQLLLAVLIIFAACKKNYKNVAKDEVNILQTQLMGTAALTNPAGGESETIEVIVGTDRHIANCTPPPDSISCEEAFELVTAELSKVIKNAGGTNIIDNPDDWKKLQSCFDKISVIQYISKSQILYRFKSNATGTLLLQRTLKVSASNANLYSSNPTQKSSALTSSMLAIAAGRPSDASLARVFTEVYGPTLIRTTINR
jgi:hypothetical protein